MNEIKRMNGRRRNQKKVILPQIKYPSNFSLYRSNLIHDNIIHGEHEIFKNRIHSNKSHLSNILVSKKITPYSIDETKYIRKKPQGCLISKIFKEDTQETHRIVQTSNSHRSKEFQKEEKLSKIIKNDEYGFLLGKGNNNEQLIKQILINRKIWKEAKSGPNLRWLFSKTNHNYKKMWSFTQTRAINHFQFNEQLTTKDKLIKNLQIYSQTKKLQLFTLTPVTFIIDFDDQYCEYNIKQFLNFFLRNDPRNPYNQKKHPFITYNFVNKFQPFMAWHSDLKKKVNQLSKPVNNAIYYSGAQNPSYIWLLKPIGLNRGRGIEIFDSLQQLQTILSEYMALADRKQNKKEKQQKVQNEEFHRFCTEKFTLNSCSFVVQKYVERPFLLEGRKFDIRVWALLTQNLSLYFFKQGSIRTSTQLYSTDNISNYFIHLTNNSIQKNSENYGMFESGNQLSFRDMIKYITSEQLDTIWQKMKEITYMSFSSVKRKLNPHNRKNCFELFGLDFIIDQNLKVWLIQVNQNPSLECSSPFLEAIIPRMVNDAFKLTIDQIFTEKKPFERAYPVKGYPDCDNLWARLGQLIPNAEYLVKRDII